MKIQTSGDQMHIRTGGITQLVIGIIFIVVGAGVGMLPFLGVAGVNKDISILWFVAAALVFGLIGLLAAWTAQSQTISLVKNGQSSIATKKLLNGKTESEQFQTSKVIAVNLATRNEYVRSASDNSTSMERRSDLHLILDDNSIIEVCSSNQAGLSFNGMNITSLIRKAPLSREAEQIAVFLGVQVKYEDLSSLQGLKDMIMGKDASQPATTTAPLNPDATANTPKPVELPYQPLQASSSDNSAQPQNKPDQQ